jgi:hypothetical protein
MQVSLTSECRRQKIFCNVKNFKRVIIFKCGDLVLGPAVLPVPASPSVLVGVLVAVTLLPSVPHTPVPVHNKYKLVEDLT